MLAFTGLKFSGVSAKIPDRHPPITVTKTTIMFNVNLNIAPYAEPTDFPKPDNAHVSD